MKCLKISEISHGASSLLFRIKYGQISNQTNLTGSQTQSIKIEAKPILAPVRPKEEDEDTVKVQKPLKDLKQSDQDNTSKAEPAPPTIEVDQQPTTLKTSQTPQETNTKPESTTKGAIQVKIEDVTAKRPSDEPNETGKRMKIEPNLTKVISETPKMRQKVNLEDCQLV